MKIQNFNTQKNIFLIAEIGNNHEGNFNIAKKLILLAKKNGADAVKFQFITPENLVNPLNNEKRIKQLKKFCLSLKQILELKKFAKKKKIIFLCSIFDLEKIYKIKNKFSLFKIPSGDNNNLKIINEYINTKKPILYSSGMLDLKLLRQIFAKLKKNRNFDKKKICLMHCVANYPLENKDSNMNSLLDIKKMGFEIGYSDHAIGIDNCLVAASLGARIIEKHFTLSNNYSNFRDHMHSASPIQLKNLSIKLKKINEMLGSTKKIIGKNEKKNIRSMRRGIYASKNLKKGKILNFKDIAFLRPETKLKIKDINRIIGKKLKKNCNQYNEINFKNLR